MKISHPDHGGNGVSRRVVNQWLPGGLPIHGVEEIEASPAIRRRFAAKLTNLLYQSISQLRISTRARNPFDCARPHVVLSGPGAQGIFAMIETVTAFLGLVSAGIFLAHAFEGFRSRA
jgi:hypothetical protein